MKIEETVFKNLKNCYKLSGAGKEMIITSGFGPRILYFGFTGGANALYCPEDIAPIDDGEFHGYGGHRFWVAPESRDTYQKDNGPCEIEQQEGRFSASSLDEETGLRKTLIITIEGDNFILDHKLENESGLLYNGSPWAITCVPPRGMVFLPWYSSEDWKACKIIYWQKWMDHSTNIHSKQYKTTKDYFLIFPNGEEGKVGTSGEQGFIGVAQEGQTFIKQFDHLGTTTYPDDNCAIQSYQNKDLVELETLAPQGTLFPGLSVTHRERWNLFPGTIGEAQLDKIKTLAGK